MARARKKRGGSRKKRSKKKRKSRSNTIPLNVLEKRLGKLNGIVKKRGGDAYTG